MTRTFRAAILLLILFCLGAAPGQAREAEACRVVRLSDIGWTDITSTTALASRLLEGLGYQPVTQILSIPVTYASIKNKQVDVFLGDWEPSLKADRAPFLEEGSVEVVGANLEGAKYTLAVPSYVAQAGVSSFEDLNRYADKFGRKFYGIESGNDGNRIISEMISANKFGLGDWTLVESSEQGMLSEVDRAIRKSDWVVFLGWAPHPMNLKYQISYLAGGDESFGPNYGGAVIYTDTRVGYRTDCPNAGRLISNLHFTLDIESQMMSMILDDHLDGKTAADKFLAAHPEVLPAWLDGVTTFDGQPGLAALRDSLAGTTKISLADRIGAAESWVTGHKIPLGSWLSAAVDFTTGHAQGFFDTISLIVSGVIGALTAALLWFPALLLVAAAAIGTYFLHRSIGLAAFVLVSLLLVIDLGYWQATIETLSLVFCASLACVALGVPIGIAAAHRPWLYQTLRPILDLMQTIPTFVYLIPTLVLFGLGVVPGLISTVVFAIPAPIRLTYLGVSSVPLQLREAGEAFGATKRQLLLKVELPYALPTIMTGVTQCIMLSLSMVVISALVGADGLGKPVVRALNSVNVSMGFEAGLAIVILAIILDRVCKLPGRSDPR
ncbi:MAG: choline ABC transporter permease subunit [Aliidongia sp.]